MHVLQFVDDKYQYKSIILTCKFFWDFYQHGFMKGTERWDHDRFVQEFTKPPPCDWSLLENVPYEEILETDDTKYLPWCQRSIFVQLITTSRHEIMLKDRKMIMRPISGSSG